MREPRMQTTHLSPGQAPRYHERPRVKTALPLSPTLGAGEFQGFACVYGNLFSRFDRSVGANVQTVIEVGAFRESVAAINARPEPRKGRIPILAEHQDVLGCTRELRDTLVGVHVKGSINLDVWRGAEWFSMLKHGAVDGMSIGFHILASAMQNHGRDGAVEHVLKAELLEVTCCLYPANPRATIDSVASASYSPGDPRWLELHAYQHGEVARRQELEYAAACLRTEAQRQEASRPRGIDLAYIYTGRRAGE